MKYYQKITGDNIYLSPMNADDLDKYLKWFNDRAVTDGLGDTYMNNTASTEGQWLVDNVKAGNHQYAVVLKQNDELIGNIGFENINNINRTCTVGLFIGDEIMRGKGYGTEALKLAVGFAFDVLNMNNVMLSVFEFNERAISSYKKAGFKEIGRRREAYYLDNKYHDVVFMDIIRDDWYK